jgi:amidohydrolase
MTFNNYTDYVKQHRINLHQIPELAFDLFKTEAYIKAELKKLGYKTINVAKTGVIAIKLGKSKETIAFRSDMDALSVVEETGLKYQSKHPGKMHACGHDGHMAMLLGFAKYLTTIKDLKKNVMLVFQPAEEGPGGAKIIVESGIFKKYNVKAIFGIHLYPDLEEGKYGLVDGPMMAQNGEFDLLVKGTSAHGAQPHKGNDAIVASGNLVVQYQNIVARFLNPLQPSVVTIGTIGGGEARNIIAHSVKMSGTVRSFNTANYLAIKKGLTQINKGIEQSFKVKVAMDFRDYYPPVINDHELFNKVAAVLPKSEVKAIEPMMFAEDFAFYQQAMPGMFIMLGTRNTKLGYTHPLHSCYFNFKEEVLTRGVELYAHILKAMAVI